MVRYFDIMTLDEIYESFIWDSSYTDDEYESKITAGINEAKKYKYLYPFIQPMIPEKSKSIWEPCARVVAFKSDEELKPYLYLLFEWLQDLNWPGAYVIYDRLLKMPYTLLKSELSFCKRRAKEENNELWLMALEDFSKHINS